MSGILTQPSSRKKFASRRKRSLEKGGHVVICIHIYIIDLLWHPSANLNRAQLILIHFESYAHAVYIIPVACAEIHYVDVKTLGCKTKGLNFNLKRGVDSVDTS